MACSLATAVLDIVLVAGCITDGSAKSYFNEKFELKLPVGL